MSSAQIEKTAQELQKHQFENFQEKIYAHLNRPDLIVGEILWFKLYAVDATLHKPSYLSKIAYVELLDMNNHPVLQTKIDLAAGFGQGSFYLPSTLATGQYTFRAYTNWMKNFDEAFFFHQSVTLINTLKATESVVGFLNNTVLLELFPEGGQWVFGLPSRTAFKVTRGGLGIKSKVALLNQKNDTVAKAITLVNGMGRFEFTPEPGNMYQAIAYNSALSIAQKSLSPINNNGYTLLVSDTLQQIKIKAYSTESSTSVAMIVHTRQSIKGIGEQTTKNGLATFFLDKEKLGDGITHITIFDGSNKPVCERLYFKKPVSPKLKVTPNQELYGTRRKITVSISGAEALTNFSMSVFRTDSTRVESSIAANILLTSDLAGFVETPEYYFSSDTNALLAADNLMLTHGWRRFNWEKLKVPKQELIYLPEIRGHLVQAKIVTETGEPAGFKTGYLTYPGKKLRFYASRSDAMGNIRFQMKDFRGTNKIILQADYQSDSSTRVQLTNPYSEKYSNLFSPYFSISREFEQALLERSISMQVQDIFREDETYYSFAQQVVDTVPFYGKPDERYRLDDYTRFPSMEDVLREYVRGVWVSKTSKGFRFRVPDKPNNKLFKDNPLILLDGLPIFNIKEIMEIDPLRIKYIDVVTQKYYVGPVELSGIVSFTSYKGDMLDAAIDTRSLVSAYEGLQELREFYYVQYSTPSARNSRLPDQRHQLYWNPSLCIEPRKSTELEFYSSDVEGKFMIVLQGISNSGVPVSKVESFSITR